MIRKSLPAVGALRLPIEMYSIFDNISDEKYFMKSSLRVCLSYKFFARFCTRIIFKNIPRDKYGTLLSEHFLICEEKLILPGSQTYKF